MSTYVNVCLQNAKSKEIQEYYNTYRGVLELMPANAFSCMSASSISFLF